MRLHPSVSVVLLACALPALGQPLSVLQAENDCLKAWKPEFEAGYGIKPDDWKDGCKLGLTPVQMLELAEKKQSAVPLPAPPPPPVPTGKIAAMDKTIAGLGDVNATLGSEALFGEKKKTIDTEVAPPDEEIDLSIPVNKQANAKTTAYKPFQIDGPAKELPVPAIDRTLSAHAGPEWFESLTKVTGSGWVPYGKALSAYLDMTGLKNYTSDSAVGYKNEGLDRYFGGMAEKDPVYARQIESFYKKVREFDAENQKYPGLRPNLGQAAGSGRLSFVEPGWAWKAALEAAGGDANAAMRIIGFCGHDDVARGGYRPPKELGIVGMSYPCPSQTSLFYLPGSLGEDADIDPELKAAVALSEKGGETRLARIPAKYYHVLGAAAAACELIRNGAPAWLAVTVQTNAGKAYRSMRMKSEASVDTESREIIRKEYNDYLKRLKDGLVPQDEETFRKRWAAERKKRTSSEYYDDFRFRSMDAHELMELWGFGLRLSGEFYPADIRTGKFRSRPKGWSDKRFEDAQETMKGMFVEQRWTTAEHQAGARFAAKVCKEKKI